MSETLIAATSEFSALFPAGAALERVATGFVWAEGGVWVPGANELRFSDIPNNRIMAWSPEGGLRTFRQPSQRTNGHTLDLSRCDDKLRAWRALRQPHDGGRNL